MAKNPIKLIKATILDLSDCDSLEEAISYFEGIRHIDFVKKTPALFDELSKAQIAVLFKLLIDLEEVNFKDNVMFPFVENSETKSNKEDKNGENISS